MGKSYERNTAKCIVKGEVRLILLKIGIKTINNKGVR